MTYAVSGSHLSLRTASTRTESIDARCTAGGRAPKPADCAAIQNIGRGSILKRLEFDCGAIQNAWPRLGLDCGAIDVDGQMYTARITSQQLTPNLASMLITPSGELPLVRQDVADGLPAGLRFTCLR